MAKDSQTRFVSEKAWERIELWSRRKPVFALMGEFSAGKSTLMNFLLRTHTLPTQVTATQLPPVWFSWGNRSAYVKRHDGTTEDITLDQLESVGVNDAQFIRIFLEADILEAVDLIDTPGISDPKISTDVWQRAVGQANGVLWCTHATQAWRETERATWVALPERLQHNSLLLVTRADALNVKDRQKVLRRVNREAGHLFNRSILFSARDAIEARDKTGDPEQWSRSGGGKMIDSFLEITEQIMDSRADQLARYQIDRSDAPLIQPVRPVRARETEEPAAPELAPLKLVNPITSDPEDAPSVSAVVTSFPVRPARVEPKADDAERPRIDVEEAERLRAEMSPVAEQPEPDDEDDDLRAFFRDTPSEPLDLSAVPETPLEIDGPESGEGEETGDEEDQVNILVIDDDEADPAIDASDDVLESLGSALQDMPEAEPAEDTEETVAADAEVTVSSITALMAEQPGNEDDAYEPEPETSGLLKTGSMLTFEEENSAPEIGSLLQISADGPLSASRMWAEVVRDEQLPTDADGLRSVFEAFLSEFDQIAIEHSGQQAKEGLRPVQKVSENSAVEWQAS